MESELDKVEPGKSDRQTKKRRAAKLDSILKHSKTKQYADPADRFSKASG